MNIREIIKTNNLTSTETNEFMEYCENKYADCPETIFPDTGYLDGWDEHISEAKQYGAADVINKYLCPRLPVSFIECELS